MKNISIALLTCFLSLYITAQSHSLTLVPWPVKVSQQEGFFLLKNKITLGTDFPKKDWTPLFNYFKTEMKKQFGISLSVAAKGQRPDIFFTLRNMAVSEKPTYELNVNSSGISIAANFPESGFYAMQTIFQLIPIKKSTASRPIPFVSILDYPRFNYRGMHLDVSRHFSPISFIKKYVDYLASYKMNTFHWHLTDDQGWRIAIDKYPLLTTTGAYRNGTIVDRYPGKGSDNSGHGGFYTKKEIKEIVDYARLRFITVIPEIEMPGHGSAAIAAYPWLSCFPDKPTEIPSNMISEKSRQALASGKIKLVQETWGVFDDIFCAGNDSVFMFLENVIDEVAAIFPSRYFHIGGDEAPKLHWKSCAKCQQRKQKFGLKDEHELQSYFVQRIEKYLNAKGKTMIGWDEIMEGGLAPNAVVMSWRGEAGGISAARQKHNAIMSPGKPMYFDHSQSMQEDSITIGGYNSLEQVYTYNPVPDELTTEEGKYILGGQANLWTEYIKNARKREYMIFPRIAALSEILWTPKENKSWERFQEQLPAILDRYTKSGINYSKAYYDLNAMVLPSPEYDKLLWKIETKSKRGYIGYPSSLGHSLITKYGLPIAINNDTTIRVSLFDGTQVQSSIAQQFHFNKATGKKIMLNQEASAHYPGDGAFTLVNGVQNKKGLARSNEFLGFEGTNCEVIIDFGKKTMFNEIIVHQLDLPGSWIYAPTAFDIAGSEDGQRFSPLSATVSITQSSGKDKSTIKFSAMQETRFLQLKIMNYGKIEDGKPGAGNTAWLFVDEIEVK